MLLIIRFILFLLFISFMPKFLMAEIITKIDFIGNSRVNNDYIESILLSKQNAEYSEELMNKDLNNIYKTGLFESVSANFNRGTLSINLKENPIIANIKIIGNKKIKKNILEKELILKKRDTFSTNKLNLDVQRLSEVYQRSGYLSAVITPKIIKKDYERVEVNFEVNEGKKSVIKTINFIGNNNYSKSDLEEAMLTKESKWWRILNSGDLYDKNRIEYDGELLKAFYLENGYPNFALVSTYSEISPNTGQIMVSYTLDEGERYKFGDVNYIIKVKSIEPYQKDLEKLMLLDKKDWFKNSLLQQETNKIRNRIKDLGFQFIKVNNQLIFNDTTNTVDIAIVIEEEPKIFVDKININGNTRSIDKIIRRELPFNEQDAFSSDDINLATRNLYRTQFFQSVDVKNNFSDTDKVNIEVNVEEMPTGTISVGGGYSTLDKLQFEASYNEGNIFGTGKNFGISTSLSANTRNYSINLSDPYFLDKNIYASTSLYRIDSKTSSLYSYSLYQQTEQGVAFSVGYKITNDLTQSFGYKIYTRNVYNVADKASLSIKEIAGQSLASIVSHNINYDKRNNALFATRGFELNLSTDYAGIIGNTDYIRNTIKGIWYYSLYDDIVFSALGSVGVITGLNGKKVNIIDKYYIGGATLRGFALGVNQGGIGPVDSKTKESLGGNYMYRGSFQIEMPIPVVKNYGLLFHIFNDYGTVTNHQKSSDIIDSGKIRSSAGFGISWRSPIGVIGLDIGFPIIKEPTDRKERILLNFGARI